MFKRLTRIFLSRKPNDSLPHRVKQNRVYIIPTRHGLLFSAMLFIMFLVSLNNNNNLALLLTFLLIGMFLISIMYTHSNLLGLKIISLSGKSVFAGEKLKLHFTFFSQRLVRPLLKLKVDEQAESIFTVNEDKNENVIYEATPAKRGVYKPKTILIETEFPFSFFRSWTYLKSDAEFLIYPKPLKTAFSGTAMSDSSDSQTGGESGKGNEDFDSLRGYQAGDPLKQIYWKGYSRGGGLHSKTYSGGKSEVLLFDFESVPENDVETKLSVLSYLVHEASINQTRFALSVPGQLLGPNSGEKHAADCLRALALFGEKRIEA